MSMSFYSYYTVPCAERGTTAVFAPHEITPNYSNSNAHMILRALDCEGFLDEYGSCASIPVFDLYGRVMAALKVREPIADDGIDTIVGGNVTHCGVRPGYFRDAYTAIAAICEWTIRHGIDRVTVA